MTREEAIEILQEEHDWSQELSYVLQALDLAITALRGPTREQVEKVLKSLRYYLETNEEYGVVYIPKFAVEKMIMRLEENKDG